MKRYMLIFNIKPGACKDHTCTRPGCHSPPWLEESRPYFLNMLYRLSSQSCVQLRLRRKVTFNPAMLTLARASRRLDDQHALTGHLASPKSAHEKPLATTPAIRAAFGFHGRGSELAHTDREYEFEVARRGRVERWAYGNGLSIEIISFVGRPNSDSLLSLALVRCVQDVEYCGMSQGSLIRRPKDLHESHDQVPDE